MICRRSYGPPTLPTSSCTRRCPRKNDIARPTMMVFDLDPGAPADIVQCCQVGLWLRDLLGKMKLKSFAKTSGSKGTAGLRAAEYVGDLRSNQGFVARSGPVS